MHLLSLLADRAAFRDLSGFAVFAPALVFAALAWDPGWDALFDYSGSCRDSFLGYFLAAAFAFPAAALIWPFFIGFRVVEARLDDGVSLSWEALRGACRMADLRFVAGLYPAGVTWCWLFLGPGAFC